MVCGFATELWSRPKSYPDGEYYSWGAGPAYVSIDEGNEEIRTLGYKGRPVYAGFHKDKKTGAVVPGNPCALKRISQDQWEGDRPLRYWVPNPNAQPGDRSGTWVYFSYNRGLVRAQYFSNYVRRMLPHAFGYVPMTGAWVMMIKFLETSKLDVNRLHNRDDIEIPDWVSIVLYGTVIIFWSFSAVQIIFQWLPPNFYVSAL